MTLNEPYVTPLLRYEQASIKEVIAKIQNLNSNFSDLIYSIQ